MSGLRGATANSYKPFSARSRTPLIERVRGLLLIARPVGELDQDKAAVLVELPGPRVLLEGPEPPRPPVGQRLSEEPRSDPLPLRVGMDIELVDPGGIEGDVADGPPAGFRDPDLVGRQDLAAHVADDVRQRVQIRQERQRGPHRVAVQRADRLRIRRLAPAQVHSPAPSSRPSIRLRFCTAAPDAPLPRLSSRATSRAWVRSGFENTKSRMRLVPFSDSGSRAAT